MSSSEAPMGDKDEGLLPHAPTDEATLKAQTISSPDEQVLFVTITKLSIKQYPLPFAH